MEDCKGMPGGKGGQHVRKLLQLSFQGSYERRAARQGAAPTKRAQQLRSQPNCRTAATTLVVCGKRQPTPGTTF